jgi:hypothetical protein
VILLPRVTTHILFLPCYCLTYGVRVQTRLAIDTLLFVKLRTAKNTNISIRNSRTIQISTHYKNSCLHGCSEDEHKMAVVTSYYAKIRSVLFCHCVTGYAYHVWCVNYSLWPLEEEVPVCSENDKYKRENQTNQSLAMKQIFII